MCGVGFSGKSTLAKKISEHTGAVLISLDALFFEKEKELKSIYPDDWVKLWQTLLSLCSDKIETNLKSGNSVVFDTTNTKVEHRDRLRNIAQSANAKTTVIFLDTSLEIQKERQRKNLETRERHDVKQEHLDKAIQELEIPTKDENVLVFQPGTNLEIFLKQL